MKFALYIFSLAIGFQYKGEGIRNVFEIRVGKFCNSTFRQLDICRKDDLFLIADFYQIKVPRGAVKQKIKEVIYKHLVEHGVLGGDDVLSWTSNMYIVNKDNFLKICFDVFGDVSSRVSAVESSLTTATSSGMYRWLWCLYSG